MLLRCCTPIGNHIQAFKLTSDIPKLNKKNVGTLVFVIRFATGLTNKIFTDKLT